VTTRNGLEHGDCQSPTVTYAPNGSTVTVSEPIIDGRPVFAFVTDMPDRLNCFVEDVTVHCIQRHMPAGLSLTEMPARFQPTLTNGGMPIWQIVYHASGFDAT